MTDRSRASASRSSRDPSRVLGFVSLVGAGPGDPGLLTVRGHRALMEAEVVLYDHLASPAVLAAIDVPSQERIHVGKAGGVAFSNQEAINALVVRRARAGQRVVRLKGGDPFVFGRGGEEALALVAAGIPFEVIPGITSANAAPLAAGIPLTHRGIASAYLVVTGHAVRKGTHGDAPSVDWGAIGAAAKSGVTLVILMGMTNAGEWSSALLAAGVSPATPVALVRWGTLARQTTRVTTLAAAASEATQLGSPGVAVVGAVVKLREQLAILERLPLFGQVIGLTRDAGDEGHFEVLERLGAALHPIPLTHQRALDPAPLILAIRALQAAPSAYTDLVFTSANGVRHFRDALGAAGRDARALASLTTWAIGRGTADAMREFLCLEADHIPPRATAEGLVEHARTLVGPGHRFLFPAAAAARRVLPEGLAALGATVDEVPCYETIPDPTAAARILSALDEGLTLLTVASPSAVAALAAALDALALPRTVVPLAAIGPTTARAAHEAGFRVAIVPTGPMGSNLAGSPATPLPGQAGPSLGSLEGLAAAIAEAAARGELPRPRPPAPPDAD